MMRLTRMRPFCTALNCLLLALSLAGNSESSAAPLRLQELFSSEASSGGATRSETVLPLGTPTHIVFPKFPVTRGKPINVAAKALRPVTFSATVYDENNKRCIDLDRKDVAANEWWTASSRVMTDADDARHVDIDVVIRFSESEDIIGTVILVTQEPIKSLNDNRQTTFVPDPASPPKDQEGVFFFWLDVAADVKGAIFGTETDKKKPVSEFKERDLPQGENKYRWNLRQGKKGPFVPKGQYVARLEFRSRDPEKSQHALSIIFKIN